MASRAWESAQIKAPIGKVWDLLRTMEFVWNKSVISVRGADGTTEVVGQLAVGGQRTICYWDGTRQLVRLVELSDAKYAVSWDVESSEPAVSYGAASHSVRLLRVTSDNSTFIEWTVDFSKDATAAVLEDARFKARDAFAALKEHAAREFSYFSTAEEVGKGHDLKGQTVLLTGGNTGLGMESARVLLLQGARVIVTVRDEKKGQAAVAELKKAVPNGAVEAMTCSLESLKSIAAFAEAYIKRGLPIHTLILNAGVMACPLSHTDDKFELQFGVNHIGHFYLTKLLMPVLVKSAPGRVVVLSSRAHVRSDVNWDDLFWTKPNTYDKWKAYGASKTANILFARQLNALFKKQGVKITVNAVHPGPIRTELGRHLSEAERKASVLPFRYKTVPQGSSTTVLAAVKPRFATEGGHYLADCNIAAAEKYAMSMENAQKLWDITEKLIADALAKK